ncbi:MAG TPA: twin-arginine translocase TatA/TatE family subunit [Pyrinomonadaceae bacterium]|nr:twin-arginine translocase TatA/TatE family subunit [Pyrinomonadaceae bacterium]
MVFLLLESLGSTELLFILAMALVFFGPRKLPQLSRTLGKNLASFRRASEDFKRTWEREVSLEEYSISEMADPVIPSRENSILNRNSESPSVEPPSIEAVPPERVIPRQSPAAERPSVDQKSLTDRSEPLPKHDWL